MDIPRLILSLAVIVLSCMIHEILHGWSALKLGDTTARDQGRLTLNPLPHIDPWMTILLPLICLISTGGQFVFGGAKPVRINPLNFRNPGFGMMVSAAAGPLSNFGLAILSTLVLFGFYQIAPGLVYDISAKQLTYNGLFFALMIFLNILLGAFNLIPIPPLDGSRVLRYVLPQGGKEVLDRIEPFGLIILIPILLLNLHVWFLIPFYTLTDSVLQAIFDPKFYAIFQKGIRGD